MLDEDLDDALARKALEEGTSKAVLIRKYVRDRLCRAQVCWLDVERHHPVHPSVGAVAFLR
jgi:hypothetical protein